MSERRRFRIFFNTCTRKYEERREMLMKFCPGRFQVFSDFHFKIRFVKITARGMN